MKLLRRFPLALLALVALGLAPAAAQAHEGTSEVVSGQLQRVHYDAPARGTATYFWAVKTAQGLQPVSLAPRLAARLAGRQVSLAGTAHGNTVAVDTVLSVSSRLAPVRRSSTGPQRLAVILIDFAGTTPYTRARAQSITFSGSHSVAAYYRDQTFGAVTFSGQVYGSYTIAKGSSCDPYGWSTAAAAQAAADGFNAANYDHVAYVWPMIDLCGWAGLGQMPGSKVWLNGLFSGAMIHELGHNLGTHHAASLRCTSGNLAVAFSATCGQPDEYGDPYDPMGQALWNPVGDDYTAMEMSPWRKLGMGALNPATDVQTISASGTYVVAPLEQSSGVRLLRIPTQDGRFLDLSIARPIGLFDPLIGASSPDFNGVSIHLDQPSMLSYQRSLLLDTNPQTATFDDAPLSAGRTFVDPVDGVSVTTTAVSDAGATVQVRMGPQLYGTRVGATAELSWSSVNGAASYQLQRDGQPITTTTAVSYNDASAAQGHVHTWTVVPLDAQGASLTALNPISLRIPDLTRPIAGHGLSVRRVSRGWVLIRWTRGSDNVAVRGYIIRRNGHRIRFTRGTSIYARLRSGRGALFTIITVDTAGHRAYSWLKARR